jgi:hypothetical protein
MRRTIAAAAIAATGLLVIAGNGIADNRTITDAEGDVVSGPPHHDFVSGTQSHVGKRGLYHTATVAGKTDETDFPRLQINTKGPRTSDNEYLALLTDAGPVVVNEATGATKPLTLSINEAEQANTYRFAFTKGAIGKPKKKYGWRFIYETESGVDDAMPNDGYANHRLKK